MSRTYEEITSDQKLLHATDMYWESRRLSVQVRVLRKDDPEVMHDVGRLESMPCVLQGSTDSPANQIIAQPPLEIASSLVEPSIHNNNEVPWVDDEVEYVGLDDEDPVSDSSDSELDDDVEYVGLEDELVVDDAWGCENIVHATDLENPRIEIGITFGDGDTFMKAIRQYAIKGEYEIAAPYSEATWYRAYCKLKGASGGYMRHDCTTRGLWKVLFSFFLLKFCSRFAKLIISILVQIKKMPHAHTCQSTGKVEKNCMETNHWVKDRVRDWLAKDATTGAKALQKRLEE